MSFKLLSDSYYWLLLEHMPQFELDTPIILNIVVVIFVEMVRRARVTNISIEANNLFLSLSQKKVRLNDRFVYVLACVVAWCRISKSDLIIKVKSLVFIYRFLGVRIIKFINIAHHMHSKGKQIDHWFRPAIQQVYPSSII